MLKTISAALLAVSVIAAPAFAGTYGNKTTHAPAVKADIAKSKALNANARMVRHHKHHRYVRHHRDHKHIGVIKRHVTPKVAVKPIVRPAKRG